MAYQRWWKTVRDQQGNAINGATCAVYNAETDTLANVYLPNSNDSSPSPQANPFVTTANGLFGFMAADGEYDVKIEGGSIASQQYRVTLNANNNGLISVMDFGAVGDGVADDTAAIQAAINSLPLHTSIVSLEPLGFANGGYIYFPSGRYKTTATIDMTRGIRISGASRESTQIISHHDGSVLRYLDAGTSVQDEIVIENISIWQDDSVAASTGAGIECFLGPASNQSLGVILKNIIVRKTYQGVKLGALIWSSIDNVLVYSCPSYGFNVEYDTDGVGSSTTSTSSTFKNCYAFLCSSGYRIKNGAYCSFVSCASDSNTDYGYIIDGGQSNSIYSCGMERNGVGGIYLNGTSGTTINAYILFATAGSPHGIVINNCSGTVLLGGVITALVASGGYGVHVVSTNGYITIIGTVFSGNFVGSEIDSSALVLNLTPGLDSGLMGSKGHWSFNAPYNPSTTTTFLVGGNADATTDTSFLVDATHVAANATRNVGTSSRLRTDNTAVTYPLTIAHLVQNHIKGAAATHSRVAGIYIEEQTAGTTATANYMIGPVGGTVPGGTWDHYSDSSRTSFWKSGQFQFLTTTGPIEKWGAGTPEGAVTAVVGSVFHRTDGGAGTCLYIKESGTGNTGWVAK